MWFVIYENAVILKFKIYLQSIPFCITECLSLNSAASLVYSSEERSGLTCISDFSLVLFHKNVSRINRS